MSDGQEFVYHQIICVDEDFQIFRLHQDSQFVRRQGLCRGTFLFFARTTMSRSGGNSNLWMSASRAFRLNKFS